jgi:hypothetical protein
MPSTRCATHRFLVTFLVVSALVPASANNERVLAAQQAQSEPLSKTEAEILIYLLPEAHHVRQEGMDIGWELETGSARNQKDFYNFWVVNAKRKNGGSVTIGFFSVNKHTAEVWDDTPSPRLVNDVELQGIQKILREGHHIDAQTLTEFGSLRP